MDTTAESGDSGRRLRSRGARGQGFMRDDKSAANRDRVFKFIVRYKRTHDGLAPSVKLIAEACDLAISTVQYHLFQLEKEQRIRLIGRRGIEVIGGVWDLPD